MKNNKQKKQAAPEDQSMKPSVQPTVKAKRKFNVTNLGEVKSQHEDSMHKPEMQSVFGSIEPNLYKEVIQNKTSEPIWSEDQNDMIADGEAYSMETDNSFNDLQRSIIMAEVLGKPRALKRNIR
jgi:hypothetical protein